VCYPKGYCSLIKESALHCHIPSGLSFAWWLDSLDREGTIALPPRGGTGNTPGLRVCESALITRGVAKEQLVISNTVTRNLPDIPIKYW